MLKCIEFFIVMNMRPLQLGFIGGALDSAVGNTHKIASQMDGRWQLAAACFSTDGKINQQTATSWAVPEDRTYQSWNDLLAAENEKLDAVIVLTPTPSHTDIVIAALEQGYAVICEKALATSSSESARIRAVVEENNSYLAVTYNYTGYPMLRELQHLIQQGKLGKLNQIHIEMPQEGFARLSKDGSITSPQAWRLQDTNIPTLSLDLGVHLHQMIDFLSAEKPVRLVAINRSLGHFRDIIDNTMCIASYTGNLDCQIWFGKTALGNSNGLRVRVYGDKGSAEWYQMDPESLLVSDNLGQRVVMDRASAEIGISAEQRYNRFKSGHPAGFIEAFANYYYDLADSLLEFKQSGAYTSPWVTGVDKAHEGLIMLETMVQSARNGTWEQMPDQD